MSRTNRPSRAARKPKTANPVMMDELEPRITFAAGGPVSGPVTHALPRGTPATVLTKTIRQTLLDGLNVYTALKNSLKSKLANNDMAGFDSGLLSYMTARTNAHFFFDISDASSIGAYIETIVG